MKQNLLVLSLVCVLSLTTLACGGSEAASWTQFGGPDQSFTTSSTGLAGVWPESGPNRVWSRELGDGYSGILYERGRLYTMYREGTDEAVVALDANGGETLWEHRYEASPEPDHVTQFGEGPRATPLIDGDRIYTIGVSGIMHALNKTDGSSLWSKDLWGEEFAGNVLQHGYSSSPIAHGDTVIVLVGGPGASVVAFDKATGEVRWQGPESTGVEVEEGADGDSAPTTHFENSYSTPTLLEIDGELQLVAFMSDDVIGLDPGSGELKWSYAHDGANVNIPVMLDANHMFLSSPGDGARGLKLTHTDGGMEVEELWATRKIQFYHVTSIRDGDWVYGSTGTGSPAFMAAINGRTGEIAWRERGMAKANVLGADGKLIILDEDGVLYLATATPDAFTLHSQVELFDDVSWTVPTLIGKTLYVRDKEEIVALDLG